MGSLIAKIFRVGVDKLSPAVQQFLLKLLTRLLDFLEKHFNNIVKHLFPIGTAVGGLALVSNLTTTIVDGATEKFGFFSRVLGIRALFENLNDTLTPYMSNWDCSFLQAFAAFGGVDAINVILNSCAYALIFWLSVVVFKWVLGLLPALILKIGGV